MTAIYLVLTCEILPAGAAQGEEGFSAEKPTCVNLAFIAFCIGALHVVCYMCYQYPGHLGIIVIICYTQFMVTAPYEVTVSVTGFMVHGSLYVVTKVSRLRSYIEG